jgi:hypothetical protein
VFRALKGTGISHTRPLSSAWLAKLQTRFCRVMMVYTSLMGNKTYGRCALFGSASSFASSTAPARSIEGACGMSPYLSALETPQY